MTVLINVAITASLSRAQVWAWRVVPADGLYGDLRVAAVAIVFKLVRAACEALFRGIAGRAFRGARFVHHITAAATMVAAARR